MGQPRIMYVCRIWKESAYDNDEYVHDIDKKRKSAPYIIRFVQIKVYEATKDYVCM